MRDQPAAAPYAALTPDLVLNSVDALGLTTTGTLLALNSYENRVFQLGVESDDGRPGYVVAKFYRPARWSDAQILEEHAFVAELAAAEVPAVPPLALRGATLHHAAGFAFSVFPRQGGRVPNLDDADVLEWIGRFLGRIHAVGAARPAGGRLAAARAARGLCRRLAAGARRRGARLRARRRGARAAPARRRA